MKAALQRCKAPQPVCEVWLLLVKLQRKCAGKTAAGVERVPRRGEWREGGSVPSLTSGGTLPVSGSVDGLRASLRGGSRCQGTRPPRGAGRGAVQREHKDRGVTLPRQRCSWGRVFPTHSCSRAAGALGG